MSKLTITMFMIAFFALPAVGGTIDNTQILLNNLGYNAGVVDGISGSKTRNALGDFYKKNGSEYDGTLDDNEVKELTQALLKGSFLAQSSEFRQISFLPDSEQVLAAHKKNFCNFKTADAEINLTVDRLSDLFRTDDFSCFRQPMKSKLSADEKQHMENFNNIVDTMQNYHAHYWAYPNSKNANLLIQKWMLAFENDFATDSQCESDSALFHKHALLSLMYSYLSLRENNHLSSEDDKIFQSEITKRFFELKRDKRWSLLENSRDTKTKRLLNNKSAVLAQIRTLYGFLFNDLDEFLIGLHYHNITLDDMKEDGALWREAQRGRFAWRYYVHALSSMVETANIYHRLGYEGIWDYQSLKTGKSLNDAIDFYVSALDQPSKMWRYSKANLGSAEFYELGDYRDLKRRDRFKEDNRENKWFFTYRSHFPNAQAVQSYADFAKIVDEIRSDRSQFQGYNSQCISIKPDPSEISQKPFERYSASAGLYQLNSVLRDVDLTSNKIELEEIQSNTASLGGDIRFSIDGRTYGMWMDIRLEQSNEQDGEVDIAFLMEKDGDPPLKNLYKNFLAAREACGVFEDWSDRSLVISIRTMNKAKLEQQDCYLSKIKYSAIKEHYHSLLKLAQASHHLLTKILEKKDLHQFASFAPKFDPKMATVSVPLLKYDRSKQSMLTKLNCLKSAQLEAGQSDVLTEEEIELLSTAFEGDDRDKNKNKLIKAGLSPETVKIQKKYLLRLVNFTGSTEAFCEKPIR